MNLELDFRSGLPIYLQIVEHLKDMIAAGRLKPDDQLPTVRALAQELRVNFNTVARAYRLLDEARVISTQQGRGTYIMEVPLPEASEQIRQHALEALTKRYLAAAARLGGEPGEIVRLVQDRAANWQENGDPQEDTKNEE